LVFLPHQRLCSKHATERTTNDVGQSGGACSNGTKRPLCCASRTCREQQCRFAHNLDAFTVAVASRCIPARPHCVPPTGGARAETGYWMMKRYWHRDRGHTAETGHRHADPPGLSLHWHHTTWVRTTGHSSGVNVRVTPPCARATAATHRCH
jgi:hypothetical protein